MVLIGPRGIVLLLLVGCGGRTVSPSSAGEDGGRDLIGEDASSADGARDQDTQCSVGEWRISSLDPWTEVDQIAVDEERHAHFLHPTPTTRWAHVTGSIDGWSEEELDPLHVGIAAVATGPLDTVMGMLGEVEGGRVVRLLWASREGGAWQTETALELDEGIVRGGILLSTPRGPRFVTSAESPEGMGHRLYLGRHEQGGWLWTTADLTDSAPGVPVQFAVDSDDAFHVAYQSSLGGEQDIAYVTDQTGTVTRTSIDARSEVNSPAITTRSDGTAMIVYHATEGGIAIATMTEEEPDVEPIGRADGVATPHSTLMIEPSGVVHEAAQGGQSDSEMALMYSRWEDGSWASRVVAPVSLASMPPVMALGAPCRGTAEATAVIVFNDRVEGAFAQIHRFIAEPCCP